jgi:hypothetical protein
LDRPRILLCGFTRQAIQNPVQNKDSKEIPEKPTVIVYGITGVYGNSSESNPLDFAESIIVSKTSNDSIFNPTSLKEFESHIMKKTGRTF